MTPYPNLISDQRQSRAGISAMLIWDPDLFVNMVLPEGVEKDLVISEILNQAAYTPLMHPDPGLLKVLIGSWSRRNLKSWEKLKATTEFEYNPIENYDRLETVNDTRTIKRSAETKDNGESNVVANSNDTSTSENLVSAENVSTYQPESKTDTKNNDLTTTDTTSTANSTSTEDHSYVYVHDAHLHGNIGVTTTQQMIAEERRVVLFTIYKAISDSFVANFCLSVW